MKHVLMCGTTAIAVSFAGAASAADKRVGPLDPPGSPTGMNQRDDVKSNIPKQNPDTVNPANRVGPLDPAGSPTGMNERMRIRNAEPSTDTKSMNRGDSKTTQQGGEKEPWQKRVGPLDPPGSPTGMNQRDDVKSNIPKQNPDTVNPANRVGPLDPAGSPTGMNERMRIRNAEPSTN